MTDGDHPGMDSAPSAQASMGSFSQGPMSPGGKDERQASEWPGLPGQETVRQAPGDSRGDRPSLSCTTVRRGWRVCDERGIHLLGVAGNSAVMRSVKTAFRELSVMNSPNVESA